MGPSPGDLAVVGLPVTPITAGVLALVQDDGTFLAATSRPPDDARGVALPRRQVRAAIFRGHRVSGRRDRAGQSAYLAAVGFATAVNATNPRQHAAVAATDDTVRSFADVRRVWKVVTRPACRLYLH
jgi:hypothetical protein